MRIHKLGVILAIILLFTMTQCKKANAEDTTKLKDSLQNTVNNKVPRSKLELLQALGGGMPKEEIKYFEANLTDLQGNTVKLSDFEGKVIFLNLWATWCPPCREEMPSMEKLHKNYEDKDFVILAVSQGEDLSKVTKFLSKTPYSFPIFIDSSNEISSQYSTGSIPTSYLIDKRGMMVAQFVGGRDWFSAEAIELINLLLAE